MKKYRKKPVIIEAEQWFRLGDVPEANIRPFVDFKMGNTCERCGRLYKDHGLCPTLEGNHIVCPGDWIIKGIKGEFYPCKPDIFEKTYEPVE